MLYIIIFAAVLIVSVLLRIASALGLTVPLLYGLLVPTLFSDWYHTNQTLAEGVFIALVGFVILMWCVSLIRKIRRAIDSRKADKAANELFLYRLNQAKSAGQNALSTAGLWRG